MKKIIFSLACMGLMTLTACDDYLDINDSPNAISSVENDYILPTPEVNIASTVGVQFNVLGGYNAQVYGQNAGCSNYLDYSRFLVTASNCQGAWTQLYSRVLQQLEVIRTQAAAEPGTYLAATVLRAYAFQLIVDAWGEAPFTEALNPSITQPVYDDGAAIYASIIAELEAAKAAAQPGDAVCANLLFGKTSAKAGTAANWIKFANTLLLKLYMREHNAVSVNDKLNALVSEGNFITEDITYDLCWGNSAGSYSPLFAESKTISNDMALNVALQGTTLSSPGDQRLSYNFKPTANGFIGVVSGTNLSSEISGANTSDFSQPNYRFDMPVDLLTVYELNFFLAEYYATIAGNHAQAEAYYRAAVAASCARCGVEDASNAVLAAYPYEQANPMKNIGIQKWVALGTAFSGFEAWCEVRRLGYPEFSDVKADDIINNDVANFNTVPNTYVAGTLYTPKNVNAEVGAKTLRQRLPYPASSTSYNNNVPATKGATVKVFWAK